MTISSEAQEKHRCSVVTKKRKKLGDESMNITKPLYKKVLMYFKG